MAKAYSYIRFSTPEQLKGDSLRRQLAGARQWCKEKGHELDDTLRDLGRSAYTGDHAKAGALREFLDLVEAGRIERGSYLLVESLDRLSREAVTDAISQMLMIANAGIVIYTLKDRQTYSKERLDTDPSALMFGVVEMYRANSESKWKAVRLRETWEEKRRLASEEGQAMTSIAPAWIRLVGGPKRGKYELVEERAAIVRSIFTDTIAGLGRRTISNRLNASDVEPWGEGEKRGERWHDSYIQKIIRNPAVIGRFEPLSKQAGGDGRAANMAMDHYYPAVVDEETFFAAQAAASARQTGEGRPSATHRNLLRGIAKCGSCGANLVIVNKGKRSSGHKLICGSAHGKGRCTNRTYYPYGLLESLTLSTLSDRMDQLVQSARDKSRDVRARRDAAIAQRSEKQARLDNLIELVASGAKSSTLAAQVTSMQTDIDALAPEIKKLEIEVQKQETSSGADPASSFLELQRQLRDADDESRLRVRAAMSQRLTALIDRIVVGNDGAHVHFENGGTGFFSGF